MKLIRYILLIAIIASVQTTVRATEYSNSKTAALRQHIATIYKQIDFSKSDTLNYLVFSMAYRGYINMMNEGMVNGKKHILTVCDFTLSSNEDRMWIIDLDTRKVLLNTYVAHGENSGEEFARFFSNRAESHQSSIGFYITAETYTGKHGYSLRLFGMDKGFNSSAYNRDIVIHGADYVCKRFIKNNKRLGRSWGCPAVNSELSDKVIELIKDHTCLYIHYPRGEYLSKSYWLNKKIDQLPDLNGNFRIQKEINIRYEYGPMLTKIATSIQRFRFPLF